MSEVTETLEAADLETLKFMAEAQSKQAEAARAAQGGFKLFQAHLSAKYKLKQGDGLDIETGAITRVNGNAST